MPSAKRPTRSFGPCRYEDADRLVQLALNLAHPLVALGVVGVFAVAEVEAKQVDPGFHQMAYMRGVADGRAEGGEDFHFLVGSHLADLGHEFC